MNSWDDLGMVIRVKAVCAKPDPCWVIRNTEETASFSYKGSLLIFSSQKLADDFISKIGLVGAVTRKFSLSELMIINERFECAVVDLSPDYDKFCTTCPFKCMSV